MEQIFDKFSIRTIDSIDHAYSHRHLRWWLTKVQGWAIGGIPKYPPQTKNAEPPSLARSAGAKGPPFDFFSMPQKGTGLNFTELTGFKLDLAIIKRN